MGNGAIQPCGESDIALAFLGDDIPALGPKLSGHEQAVTVVRHYARIVEEIKPAAKNNSLRVTFHRQRDGRYTLIIRSAKLHWQVMRNIDELMLWRLKKAFRRHLVVLTSFYYSTDKGLQCLALTDGLGVVLWAPRLFS